MKRLLRISTFLPGLVILSLALVRCVSAETDMAPAAAVEAADFSLFLLPLPASVRGLRSLSSWQASSETQS